MMSNTLMRMGAALLLLVATHTAVAAAKATEPQEIVQQTTEQVLQALRTEGEALKKDRQRLYQLINDLIVPHFDFRQMSKWVLGPHWRKASDAEKSEFTRQFESLLVRTYSDALVEFRDESVAFLPIRERSDTEVAVRSTINRSAGPAVPITYQMHKVGDGWKIYDVAIEGVSLVINYRSSFAQEIKRNGIDGLIRRLAKKNSADGG